MYYENFVVIRSGFKAPHSVGGIFKSLREWTQND